MHVYDKCARDMARRSYIMSTQFIFSLRKNLNLYAGVIEKEVVESPT